MSGYYGYELNWLGIALASLAPLVVGAIWYHPKVFGQMWMDALGFKEEDLRKGNMAVLFGVTFLMSFTLAYYFAMRYHGHGEDSSVIAHAAYHGFMTFGYLGMPISGVPFLAGLVASIAGYFVSRRAYRASLEHPELYPRYRLSKAGRIVSFAPLAPVVVYIGIVLILVLLLGGL